MPHNLFAMNMMMIMLLMVIGDDLTNLDDAAYCSHSWLTKTYILIVSYLSNQRDIFYLVTIQPRSFTNENNDMHGAQD